MNVTKPVIIRQPFDFGELEPLFWGSMRPDYESAWHGHVSFAHWLVRALRPDTIVELGTHAGVSFSAFCQAVKRGGGETRCFAVDRWTGDEQAGYSGEDVYADLLPFVRQNFGDFAALVRCSFDEALSQFPDHTIDLLHIDGRHDYASVKHDFETWLPKMSARGVILFHDTQTRLAGFGVQQLWSELCGQYEHFEFEHSAGLGVILAGRESPPLVASLCANWPDVEILRISKAFEQASMFARQHGQAMARERERQNLVAIPAGRVNLALGKYAAQSSSHMAGDDTPGGAVNGLKTGHYGFHTNKELLPWWMVDLGFVSPVGEIVIYNRLDKICRPRVRNLVVQVSENGTDWVDQYTHDGSSFGGADGHPLRIRCYRRRGRFIRIYLNDNEFLHLDEVEVYAEPPPE